MRYIILISILFIIKSCSVNYNKSELQIDTTAIINYNSDGKLVINNNTDFSVKILLESNSENFKKPSSNHYYSIGSNKIGWLDEFEKCFLIPGWRLQISGDSILFIENKSKYSPSGTSPLVSLNYQYPNKYGHSKTEFHSDYFGDIKIQENGMTCDDSYSGTFTLINNQNKIVISNLANIDIFESKNKELYILSYHNCLLPDLKIIRIK